MNTQKDRNYYSKKQFKELFRNLNLDLHNFPGCTFEGLWAFSYAKGANSLKHCYFQLSSGRYLDEGIYEQIKSAFLDCDHGTLGAAFKELTDSEEHHFVKEVLNTFNDAAGVVCYTDAVIKQEHAFFILIKEGDDILGILDLFFTGDLDENGGLIIKNKLAELFEANRPLAMASVIAFKMREHEDFLEIQSNEGDITAKTVTDQVASSDQLIQERITGAVAKLAKISAVSSYTPLFYIKDIDGSVLPELVGLNFDYIHSLIKHEYSFCPLTSKKDCFYFKPFQSFKEPGLFCDNIFLKKYYHNVMRSLDGYVVKEEFNMNGAGYVAEIIYQPKAAADHSAALTAILMNLRKRENDIRSELEDFSSKYNFRPNDVAKQKYQDELIFKHVKESINDDPLLKESVIIIIIYKMVSPHLLYEGGCDERNDGKRNIKDFISLSNLLQKRHRGLSKDDDDDRTLTWQSSSNLNVANFEIYNTKSFESALRTLIASDPDSYRWVLAPYLKSVKGGKYGKTASNGLDIFYTGGDPFRGIDNDYLAALEAQIYLLVGLLKSKETIRYARKAAISQVLARNMSHNHGSHVLSRMIHPDQIKSLDNMHESLRRILSRKTLS